GPAVTLAQRVTALDHEPGDDPVEDRAVVELRGGLLPGLRVDPLAGAFGQLDEVAHGHGRRLRKELHLDGALGGAQCRYQLLSHGKDSPLCRSPRKASFIVVCRATRGRAATAAC